MATASEKVIQLRQLLAERFEQAGLTKEEGYATGLALLDECRVPRSALTEIVAAPTLGPCGALLLYGLLHAAIQKGERIVLIDGASAFAPKGAATGRTQSIALDALPECDGGDQGRRSRCA